MLRSRTLTGHSYKARGSSVLPPKALCTEAGEVLSFQFDPAGTTVLLPTSWPNVLVQTLGFEQRKTE